MASTMPWPERPHTVTFDCWATLLLEVGGSEVRATRIRILAEFTGVDESTAAGALDAAWRQHQVWWHRRLAFTGVDMTKRALELLSRPLSVAREKELVEVLETVSLGNEVRALEGARDALERLARAGVRRALICDTGFTPGRVVRTMLDRVGLLEFLEVTVFSDEVGVPKPDTRAFHAALSGLGVGASGAVHVGDLRRSDIAGAKAFKMGSVRLRAHHDDAATFQPRAPGVIDCSAAGCTPECERPEADAVADTFEHLQELLGFD